MSKSVRTFVKYASCAVLLLVVLLAFSRVLPGPELFGVYYCVTFWALVCTEGYLSMVRGVTIKSRWAAEDRFLGYLFTAPFIWPVRLHELLAAEHNPA